ncbi:hypothetical protein [Haloarcula salinisoli]|uniref:DUF7998 domain-containing protein n=1 Tax=Haloarcula salinisoli TaxID=2487746 RepID=A0A8J7YB06_9EURY|nr:hypothetical protein [Halomicroarcula salinisoli]MBX0286375.1 hypothetical protein [Halomicroarcula salinisoli]MBX0302137.1 hypothetical protein [Halomicroarcula salinisoli]
MNVPNPFSTGGDDTFDAYDEFVPDSLPEPGLFLADHSVLTGPDHLAVHRLARSLFETRGVYDMTFGYNLARLNVDRRHPDAGFRYAREADDDAVLRAEFTPTTEFCPQSDTLTVGAMRAFNGEGSRHEYDLVRVRVAPMHQEATAINGKLEQLEAALRDGEDSASSAATDSNSAPF